jgi:hypothetical protein
MADTIDEALSETALAGVKRVTVDGQSVEALSIDELVAARQAAAAASGRARNHLGLTFRQFKPGDTG